MSLKANNEVEKRVLEYVLAHASPDLMARIDAEGKTMQGCMKYITSYAKAKIAMDKRHGEVCVPVPPEEVFGQVMHYFEDEAEGAIYKSPEELKREAESKRREEERLAALTPEEREAEERAKAEAEAKRKADEELRRKRDEERKAREQAKREAEKRKRKLEEAQMCFSF